MSVWLDKPKAVRTVDIRRPDGQLCDRFFKILLKLFPDLSHVRTVLPCCPAGPNFHIKPSRVRTKGMVVQTVDLMHAISIYVAPVFGP
jgi:hypothetical protein